MTKPDILGLVFDTGHWRFGGGDEIEGLRQHAERIWHVHFKDHDRGGMVLRYNSWPRFTMFSPYELY